MNKQTIQRIKKMKRQIINRTDDTSLISMLCCVNCSLGFNFRLTLMKNKDNKQEPFTLIHVM